MDLLAGYGSDSGSEPGSPAPAVGAPPPPAEQPAEAAPQPPTFLSSLPSPASERAPLFSCLPTTMPVVRHRKRFAAKFSCPIDFGDVPAGLDDDKDDEPAAKKLRKGAAKGVSLSEFLPAPKNSLGGGALSAPGKPMPPPLGSGGIHYDDDDDDDIVPGAEDPSGMYLGKGTGEPVEDEGDGERHIRGTYQGQEYIYDTVTGQYYYPEASEAPQQPQQQQQQDLSGLQSGIQFKEISGAQLRYMDPGQRAEVNALRSALGDDYESKLKADAARVGAVSKTARRKHQLTSLYVQSKEQELEDMEKRASGAKTKQETQRKYGW